MGPGAPTTPEQRASSTHQFAARPLPLLCSSVSPSPSVFLCSCFAQRAADRGAPGLNRDYRFCHRSPPAGQGAGLLESGSGRLSSLLFVSSVYACRPASISCRSPACPAPARPEPSASARCCSGVRRSLAPSAVPSVSSPAVAISPSFALILFVCCCSVFVSQTVCRRGPDSGQIF